MSPPGRWALTPPFHPYQTKRAIRRRLEGFPPSCHRAALRRRYLLCGAVRDRIVPNPAPWRYQARCPLVPSLAAWTRVSGLSSRPAILRWPNQRSPGPPAIPIIPRSGARRRRHHATNDTSRRGFGARGCGGGKRFVVCLRQPVAEKQVCQQTPKCLANYAHPGIEMFSGREEKHIINAVSKRRR
jgi:hypothetical protein